MPRTSTRTAFTGTRDSALALKTYVLDTSVLLSDPYALLKFAEHSVVVPIVVITELEAKRHHPELGYFTTGCAGGVPFHVMGATTEIEVEGEPSSTRVVRAI